MQNLLFTKLFGSRPLDEIGKQASDMGFDGIDLLIRPGTTVTYEDTANLSDVVARLKGHGLSVPMATTDLTDPAESTTKDVFTACADAGIEVIRLGYWKYNGDQPYNGLFEKARRDLDGLVKIAEPLGLNLSIQLHGSTIHASGALTAALLEGHDISNVSSYPDPGNQTVQNGREDWRLTFDLLGPWLKAVGVKNGGWFPSDLDPSGQRTWRSTWLGIADGMVPWHEISAHLRKTAFDGFLTFHSHYELPYQQVLDQTRNDLSYVRSLFEENDS
ncbi:MAG: sugar phosphate isomerase/epimerase family protein [Arachnia sp.]